MKTSKQESSAMATVRAQTKRAIIVQFLVTGPAHRITHAFDFNFCAKPQALPFGVLWQNKLRLPHLSRKRVARIEAATLQGLSIFTLNRHAKNTGDSGYTVICKPNNQSAVTSVFVRPDEGWPHAIANAAADPVKPGGKCL